MFHRIVRREMQCNRIHRQRKYPPEDVNQQANFALGCFLGRMERRVAERQAREEASGIHLDTTYQPVWIDQMARRSGP